MRRIVASLAAALVAAAAVPLDDADPEVGPAPAAADPLAALTEASLAAETPALAALQLHATLASGGPALVEGVSWSVTNRATGAVVLETAGGALDAAVAPGLYLVEVSWTGWSDGLVKTGRLSLDLAPDSRTVRDVPVDLGVPVTLAAPASARDGDLVAALWSAPAGLPARLDIAPVGARVDAGLFSASLSEDGAETDDPRTAWLQAPGAPGAYEVRLVLEEPEAVLARAPLQVGAYDYALEAPGTAAAGGLLTVGWRGPGHPGDLITLMPVGDLRSHDPARSTPARSNPAEIALPAAPGVYELRYVSSAQRQIKVIRTIELAIPPLEDEQRETALAAD